MREYQEAAVVHEPHRIREAEDRSIWGYEVTSKHTPTWGYGDARMQARAYEPEDMGM